ncbi:MAG: hypothetical protein PHD82_07335 [Candidatus Riflebacteria bacterium]|jgi:hypothetical protein|nr:hypothetical protein [Candidatus Riflebacteria bacterium]
MDQARWLIVLSVIICMTASLALLQRFAGQPDIPAGSSEVFSQELVETPVASVLPEVAAGTAAPVTIRYPEPPAHIFSVPGHADAQNESAAFRDQGKISE